MSVAGAGAARSLPTHIRPAHLLLLLAINLAWAANNVAVKEAVIAMPPLAAAALRFALVALFCLPWLRWVPGRMVPILAVALFQGALHFACLNLAYAAADNVAALALVGQAGVPFALLLAVLVLGERIALIRSIAIAVCLVGVAIIGFDPAVVDEIEGAALVVLASFWYAVSTIFLKRITGIHHFTILAWLGLVASATLVVASLLAEPGAIAAMGSHAPIAYAAVGFSALFSSMLGHGGANALIQRYPVSWIMPLFIPAPVLAAVLGAWVYDLPVTWRLVVGGGLAVAGAAVITLRTARPRATGDA